MLREKIKRLKDGDFILEANTGNPVIMARVLFMLSLVSFLKKDYKDGSMLLFAFLIMTLIMPFILLVYMIFLPFRKDKDFTRME